MQLRVPAITTSAITMKASPPDGQFLSKQETIFELVSTGN
jgi:hypothetical protein